MNKQPTIVRKRLLFMLLASIVLAVVAHSHNAAASDGIASIAESGSDEFGGWSIESQIVPNTSFDVTRCSGTDDSLFQTTKPILTADINADGKTDLLCFYKYVSGAGTVFARFAEDDGYSEWTNINATPETLETLDTCEYVRQLDFDGDGDTDFACINTTNGVWVGIAQALGSMYRGWYVWTNVPGTSFDGENCLDIYVIDLEADGQEELICPYLYPSGSSRTFKIAWDDPGWQPAAPLTSSSSFALTSCYLSISVGDVDGNGEDDLICEYMYDNGSGNSATFVQLAQDGELSPWTRWSANQSPSSFLHASCFGTRNTLPPVVLNRSFMSADVDGDGLNDQICAYAYDNGTGNSATFVKTDSPSSSGSTYSPWANWRPIAASSVTIDNCLELHAVDTNRDGLADLVCVYRYDSGSTVTLVQESTGSEFSEWQRSGPITGGTSVDIDACLSIDIGDANGDRHPDFICTYLYPSGATTTIVQYYQPNPTLFLPVILR